MVVGSRTGSRDPKSWKSASINHNVSQGLPPRACHHCGFTTPREAPANDLYVFWHIANRQYGCSKTPEGFPSSTANPKDRKTHRPAQKVKNSSPPKAPARSGHTPHRAAKHPAPMEANNNPPHNSGPPAAGAGWLPSAVRKGSSALAQGDAAHRRVQVACRQCKAAKAKCDMSRPCRRCLYRGAGDECAPAGGDEEPAGDADDAPEPSKRAKRPRAAAYEPRDGGPRGGAKHRTGAPANGDEYFDVSLPDLMVLAVSPALAQRYTRTPFAGPAGTFLLAWVYEPDVAKVLTQMLRCHSIQRPAYVHTHLYLYLYLYLISISISVSISIYLSICLSISIIPMR